MTVSKLSTASTPTGAPPAPTTPGTPTADPKLITVSKLSTASTPTGAPPAPTTPGTPTADPKLITVSKLSTASTPTGAPPAPTTPTAPGPATPTGITPSTTKDLNFVSLAGTPTAPGPTAPGPVAPAPADADTPPPANTTMTPEDAKKLNGLYGELNGKLTALSSINRSKAAAIVGQDFSTVKAETSEGAFVPQVSHFLNEIVDDGKKLDNLGKDATTYQNEVEDIKTGLFGVMRDGNYTLEATQAAIDPGLKGQLKAATEEMANSTATLAEAGKTYAQNLGDKAQELLGAWDQTKHLEHKADVANAISTVFSVFANVGIGGNAIVQSAIKDAAETMQDVGRVWNSLGLRVGQVENLFGAITNAGLSAWKGSNPASAAAQLDGADATALAPVKGLYDRFSKYVDDFNNQEPPDPNPFVIV